MKIDNDEEVKQIPKNDYEEVKALALNPSPAVNNSGFFSEQAIA